MFRRRNEVGAGNLHQQAAAVERILAQLGISVEQARMPVENGYGWTFQRGSAVIEVYIAQVGGREYFQVLAPLIHLPTSGLLALYRRLLELNLQLTNAALGVHQDVIFLFIERPLVGLDAEEANFIITQIAEYADELDNQLLNEFGGRLYSQVN